MLRMNYALGIEIRQRHAEILPLIKIFLCDCIQSRRCGVMLAERKNGNSKTTCRQSCCEMLRKNLEFFVSAVPGYCLSACLFPFTKEQESTEQGPNCCSRF